MNVPVPETSVNQYDLPAWIEHDVRLARQALLMQAVPIAHTMQEPLHHNLGFGISPSDKGHILRPACLVDRIGYANPAGCGRWDTTSSFTLSTVTHGLSEWTTR